MFAEETAELISCKHLTRNEPLPLPLGTAPASPEDSAVLPGGARLGSQATVKMTPCRVLHPFGGQWAVR